MNPGNRWRPMIRAGFAPISFAAVQNSSSRNEKSFDRTARARLVHSISAKMMVMAK